MEWERQRTYDREAGREEGRTEGRAEGSAQKAIDDARNFLAKTNLSPEVIAECCSLPLEKVMELKENVLGAAIG